MAKEELLTEFPPPIWGTGEAWRASYGLNVPCRGERTITVLYRATSRAVTKMPEAWLWDQQHEDGRCLLLCHCQPDILVFLHTSLVKASNLIKLLHLNFIVFCSFYYLIENLFCYCYLFKYLSYTWLCERTVYVFSYSQKWSVSKNSKISIITIFLSLVSINFTFVKGFFTTIRTANCSLKFAFEYSLEVLKDVIIIQYHFFWHRDLV